MVISKTNSTSSVDARETLVPIISAAAGAALAVVLHESFPVMAGIAGALAGAAAGMLLQKRNSSFALSPAAIDPREVRINALETELACERTMHEAFKRDATQREEELKRFLADIEMTHSVLEGQACQSVELAEELAEQKQRSDYLATHDMLTGLPNRLAFQEELKRRVEYAGSSGSTIALLFVDLDRFKEINDTLGHEAGDVLLQQVAGMFGTAMRQDDFAARLGGDEFAVIVEIPPEEAREVAVLGRGTGAPAAPAHRPGGRQGACDRRHHRHRALSAGCRRRRRRAARRRPGDVCRQAARPQPRRHHRRAEAAGVVARKPPLSSFPVTPDTR